MTTTAHQAANLQALQRSLDVFESVFNGNNPAAAVLYANKAYLQTLLDDAEVAENMIIASYERDAGNPALSQAYRSRKGTWKTDKDNKKRTRITADIKSAISALKRMAGI